MAPIMYRYKDLRFNNRMVPLRLRGDKGCANLVAVHNMLAFKGTTGLGMINLQQEQLMISILEEELQASIDKLKDMPREAAEEAKKALANIRTGFCLEPRLTGHLDFAENGPKLVLDLLGLPVLHAWVLDTQEETYDHFCQFSHLELVDYSLKEDNPHIHVSERILGRNLTSYGIETLHAELTDNGAALLCRRDKLDVICKHAGHVFIFVSDETTRNQIKNADWLLFEEQEESIYFNADFVPVKDQPHKEKALKWFREHLVKLSKSKDDKGVDRKKASQEGPSDDSGPVLSIATGKKAEASAQSSEAVRHGEVLSDAKKAEAHSVCASSDSVGHDGEVRSDATGQKVEAHCVSARTSEAAGSHQGHGEVLVKSPQQESSKSTNPGKEAKSARSSEAAGSHQGHGEVLVKSPQQEISKSTNPGNEEKSARSSETAGSHQGHGEVLVKSPQQESSKSTFPGKEANSEEDQDGVLVGDALDFFTFLDKFMDSGCTNFYFKGAVAAFASQRPFFYVPFDFIMSFNKSLAVKIRDNYSGVYEALKKAVVHYLSKHKVDSPKESVLKILGRPEDRWQSFMDFVESIVLHEQYYVLDEYPQELPSYDGRRMGLGFLACIIAKFKTGRSWNGKWTKDNMRVKNGVEFLIDLEADCELTADTGYEDLSGFCKNVLDHFTIDGQLLPYFDELAEDFMLINTCFGDPKKWPRFLALIGNPLALKPPLVRAAFLCNIHLVGDAHSSGNRATYAPLNNRRNCDDYRIGALKHPVLEKVFRYPLEQKFLRYKYLNDHWLLTHWHVFKFSRIVIQHGLGYTKGKDLTQEVADISVLDVLLACNISQAIAKSVRFLVLYCGVDGIFSSPWRHFVGSDYMDKQETIAGDLVQRLLTSREQKSGYLYSEIQLYSQPQHLSIISDIELTQLQTYLSRTNILCVNKGDHLEYGPVKLRKLIVAATKEVAEHGVIVVQGPYSAEYDSLYDALMSTHALMKLPTTL